MKTAADLRETLFATLDALRDKTNPMDIDRAKAISDVAQTIINVAKVEVDYLKLNGGGDSEFIGGVENDKPPKGLPNGIVGITRHRLEG